jgi:hypothetical protein
VTQPDARVLYEQRLPELFDVALARLEPRLFQKLALAPTPVRVRFEGEGGGELGLLAGRDGFSFADPAGFGAAEFGFALSVTTKAAHHGLHMIDRGELALDEIARGVAMLGSRTSRELFGRTPFSFEIDVVDVPVLGTVRNEIRMGRTALSAPEFMLSVDYDDLADAREDQVPPHQLFLDGKVRIRGDASKAMLLGVTLAQLIK